MADAAYGINAFSVTVLPGKISEMRVVEENIVLTWDI